MQTKVQVVEKSVTRLKNEESVIIRSCGYKFKVTMLAKEFIKPDSSFILSLRFKMLIFDETVS